MKKFLTVLLALSVVFTYTVGSSFAAAGVTVNAQADPTYTLSEVETAIYAQAQKNVDMLNAVKANFLANYDANQVEIEGVTLSKAAVEKEIDKIFKDIAAKINAVADEQKADAIEKAAGTTVSYVETDVWAADLYTDDKGTTAATVDNAFDPATGITDDATLRAAVATGIYIKAAGNVTKVEDANATFDGSATYVVKKGKWYKKDTASSTFTGFTAAEKLAYETAVNTEYLKYDTAAEVKALIDTDTDGKYGKALLTAEHAIQKAEVTALLDKVDVTKYSDNIPSDADQNSDYYLDAAGAAAFELPSAGYYSYQARVKAVLDAAKKALAEKDIVAADDESAIATKIGDIANADAFFKTNITDKIGTVPTIQDEAWDKEDLEKGKERITSAMKSHLADLKNTEYATFSTVIRDLQRKEAQGITLTAAEKTQLAEAQAALAALDADYKAVEDVYANQIKNYKLTKVNTFFEANGTIKASEIAAAFPVDATAKELAVVKAAKVVELQNRADLLNQMTGFDGKPMYDKDVVAAELAAKIAAVYDAADKAAVKAIELVVNPNYDLVKAEMNRVLGTDDANATVEFNKKIYKVVAGWTANDTTYDAEKLAEVKGIIADTKAAIRAAKTVEAVDEAFLAGYAKYDAVLTLADREAAQIDSAYAAKIAEYTVELGLLIDAKVARYGANFDVDFDISAADLKAKLIGTADKNDGLYAAYTLDEMKAIYDEAVKTVNGLKSTAALDAEVAALNTAILAVKVPVTAESKTAILALQSKVDAFKEYAAFVGYDATALRDSLLATLVSGIKAIDAEAITDAVAAIMKDGKITLDEKAAVEAACGLIDAYIENYGDDAIVTGDVETVYEFDFTDLEVAAVETMIAKIDPTAKPLDVEAIKAAREAYDALGETTISAEMYAKLLSLETLAAEVNNDRLIAGVRGTSLTASSTAVKGAIKVTWKKSAGYKVDYYEVYRSTKKSSGYGTKPYFTTKDGTAKSYKNTKSLKKGTRYYYKVRGVRVIDGKKYYTQWSNKAYRVAK